MSVVFAHYTRTRNIGDLASGPYRYFDLGAPDPAAVRDVRDGIPEGTRIAVFGGGALVPDLSRRARTGAEIRIGWGIGDTGRGKLRPGTLPGGFDLLGVRDWPSQTGALWVPCPSCMLGFFDKSPAPTVDAVLYLNADSNVAPPLIDGLPRMYNVDSLAAVIAFLASARVVVTNSYHGAYWATLLGRKVVIAPAWSLKLRNFRHQPAIADDGDWRGAAERAPTFPLALQECRDVNADFARLVRRMIG